MDPWSDDIDIEELDRLEKIARLENELKEANQKVLSRAGENAILQSNLQTTKKAHQREISDLIHANARLKQEFQKEVAEVQNDLERLKTERQFLQNEITDLYRSRPVRSSTKSSSKGSERSADTSVDISLNLETPSKQKPTNMIATNGTSRNTSAQGDSSLDSEMQTTANTSATEDGVSANDRIHKGNDKKRTKQQQRDFEAMFRSGFDTVSISPRKKKLRAISIAEPDKKTSPLRTEVMQLRNIETPKARASGEIVTTIEDATFSTEDRANSGGQSNQNLLNEFRIYIYQLALPGSPTPIMQQLVDYDVQEGTEPHKSVQLVIQKALFANFKEQAAKYGIEAKSAPEALIDVFILTCMNQIMEMLPDNIHPLLLALIQGSIEFKHVLKSSTKDEIFDWIILNSMKYIEVLNSSSTTDECDPENQPSFRTLRLPSTITNSTTNILFYLDILDALIGNSANLEKQRLLKLSTFMGAVTSPKLPSQVIVKAMYILQYQSIELPSLDNVERYLNGETVPQVSLILLLDEVNHLSIKSSKSNAYLDLNVKYDSALKHKLQSINALNVLLIKQLAVKKMMGHILWTNSVASIASNNGIMSSLIDCLTQQLEAVYDNDTSLLTMDFTSIAQERVKLCEYVIRLLHGIWMISPDSPTILSNLEAKFGYQFIVSLSGVAFSTANSKFSDQVIEQARAILEQCTTLSEADDIYLSMNPA